MKYRRVTFIAICLVFLIGGLYTGEKIYFAAFFALLFMLLTAVIINIFTIATFHYTQQLTPATGIKGDIVTFTIRIYNDKPFPFPYIKIYYDVLESSFIAMEKSAVLSILPGKYGEIQEKIPCSYWGKYPIGMKRIEVRDMFGLLTFSMDITKLYYYKNEKLVIYPRVLRLNRLPVPLMEEEGRINQEQKATEEFSSVSDIRSYRYGDPLKKIHWKLSSRRQELLVKNYEESSQPDTLLFMDCTPTFLGGLADIEIQDKLVECATAVVHYILSKWLPVRMVTYFDARQELKGNKPSEFQSFYDFFASLSFQSKFPLEDVLLFETRQLNHVGGIFVITHTLTEKLFDIILLLKASGVNTTLLLVAQEDTAAGDISRIVEKLTEKGVHALVVTPGDNFVEKMEAIA